VFLRTRSHKVINMNEEEHDMRERRRQKGESYNKGDTMSKRMIKLEKELEERKQDIIDKNLLDTRIYGKPLGCGQLVKRVKGTLNKIKTLEKRIEKEQKTKDNKLRRKWIGSRDRRTLNDIRHNIDRGNTSTEATGGWDNRYRGSHNSRMHARAEVKRGKKE